MGAFDVIPNITLPDPDKPEEEKAFRAKWRWEAHEQVILKGVFTAGDQEAMTNVANSVKKIGDDPDDAEVEVLSGSARLKLLELMIVDWTLRDGNRKAKVGLAMIKRLPTNYTVPILEVCDRMAAGLSKKEKKSLPTSANGHSPETSVEENQPLLQS
jgi:hypothetical protein